MRGLYNVLRDSRYPSLFDLFDAITDRLENDLIRVHDNCTSGECSMDEVAEQIDDIIRMIVRKPYDKREEFLDKNKVRKMINVEILNRMNDGSAASVLRKILFSEENKIDWDEVYIHMMEFMPELKNVDDYKEENME